MKNLTYKHRALVEGFTIGLAQVVSATGTSHRSFPAVGRLSSQAFKGDWQRLGGDMRHATTRVMDAAKK